MLIAQLSDIHAVPPGELLMGRVDTFHHLRQAVDALLRLTTAPDLVLVTGDLAENGLAAEYELVRGELGRLPMPVYVIPGNHDDRRNLHAAFAPDGYLPAEPDRPLHYAVELGPMLLVALDTLVEGEPGGELDELGLAWLKTQLKAATGRPALVAMHHPPFDTGIGHMDAMGCRGHAALAALLAGYPNVERVVCGHVHRAVQVRFGGTLASIAPGVAHQVAFALDEGATPSFVMEPPAFHLHLWRPKQGLVTHQIYVEPAPGPFPFA